MSETVKINNVEVDAEQFRNDWALALMSQGIIVRLTIGRWRATAKLTESDLGLRSVDDKSAQFMHKYIKLGIQKLLPPEIIKEIDVIETRARMLLVEYSFDTVWGRFIPNTAFANWKSENEVIRSDFMKAAVLLGNRYDEIIASIKTEYKNLARDVWARLYPEDSNGATDSYIENFVSKIVNKIPSREDIVSSFKYESTYFIIPMPSLIEENISRAMEIRRNSEMEDFKANLERETRQRVAGEYIQRKRELIDGFLDATVANLRKYVAELCDGVLQSIVNKKQVDKVTLRDVNKLKKMVKKVRILNFHEDIEVTNLLNELELEIDKFKGERNDDVVVNKLKEIVEISQKEFLPSNFNPAIGYLEV